MTNEIEVLSEITENELINKSVKEVIAVSNSKSTNSLYLMVRLENEDVVTIGFSDHYNFERHENVVEDLDFDTDILKPVFEKYNFKFDEDEITIDEIYYGVSTSAKKYDTKEVANLIGKKSAERAIVNDHYTIDNATLSCDDRLLTITYDNGESEDYMNFIPSQEIKWFSADELNDLSKGLSPYEIRRALYNDCYELLKENELEERFENSIENDEEVSEKVLTFNEKTDYVFEDDEMVEEYEAINGNNNYVYVVTKKD